MAISNAESALDEEAEAAIQFHANVASGEDIPFSELPGFVARHRQEIIDSGKVSEVVREYRSYQDMLKQTKSSSQTSQKL